MPQVTTGGIKRGAPEFSTPDAERRMTSDQFHKNLEGQITSPDVRGSFQVSALLRQIAYPGENGIEPPGELDTCAQEAFSILIEHHEFAPFAEVFQRYSEGRRKFAEHMGDTFEPSLTLRLSEDWQAGDLAAMKSAFIGLGLKSLTVKAPFCTGSEQFPVMSEDACLCIQLLLRNAGVTRLHMEAPLAAPELVAEAFALSGLQSLTLNGASGIDSYTPTEWAGYQRLCLAIASCRKLEHLKIRLGIQQASTVIASLVQKDAPPISNLNVTLGHVLIRDAEGMVQMLAQMEESESGKEQVDDRDAGEQSDAQGDDGPDAMQCATQVLGHVHQMQALGELSLHLEASDDDEDAQLSTEILRPLQGHKSLHTLRVSDGRNNFEGPNVNLMVDVVEFSNTCPMLTSVGWTGDDGHPEDVSVVVRAFIEAGGKFLDEAADKRLKDAMLSGAFKLQTLIVGGALVPTSVLATFLQVLRLEKLSLETVVMKACVLDVGAMEDLEDVVKDNPGILVFEIPEDPSSGYCLTQGDGRVYTFAEGEAFSIRLDQLDDEEARAAEAAWLPLEAFANRLLSGVPAQTAQNRRAAMARDAVRTLTPNLAGLLSLGEAAQQLQLGPQGLSIAAEGILQQLAIAGEFPSAARLSRVVAKLPEDIDPDRANYNKASVRGQVESDLARKREARNHQRLALLRKHAERVKAIDGYAREEDLNPGSRREQRFQEAQSAVKKGDVDRLLDLIDDGLWMNIVRVVDAGAYNILLDLATTFGSDDVLRILLQKGAIDPDGLVGRKPMYPRTRAVFEQYAGARAVTTTNSTLGTTTTAHATAGAAGETRMTHAASTNPVPTEAALRLYKEALGAIAAGDLAALGSALNAGVPVNHAENDTNVLLVAAVQAGQVDMVKLLMASGAEDYFGMAVAQAQTQEMIDALDGR